jgi:hypothetical protein
MVLFLGRLVSPAMCIVGNIGSNVCITGVVGPLVLHHALWSQNPQVTEVIRAKPEFQPAETPELTIPSTRR